MSDAAPTALALFWAGAIAASILIYVILDGFDLGVGILFGSTPDEDKRIGMMNTIAPFWDGNETWLVVIGAALFATFPVVYAVFLGAFYLPVLLMLLALIFRGIAFEFRERSRRMRPVWDRGFFIGSVLAAFAQGAALGALMRGVPVVNDVYAGDSFGWLHPFPVFTGIGLVFGYALLGAGWLVLKSEGSMRDWAYARIPWLVAIVFAILGLAFLACISVDAGAIAQNHLRDRGWGWVFPAIAAAALVGVLVGARQRRDRVPFALTVVFIVCAYVTLAVMMFPYMIPYTITVGEAAAPDASLQFLFYGGVVVLPVIGVYTAGVYWVFRGKVRRT